MNNSDSIYNVGDKILFNVYHKKRLYEGDPNSIQVTNYSETLCGVITKVFIIKTILETIFEYQVDNRKYIVKQEHILTKI